MKNAFFLFSVTALCLVFTQLILSSPIIEKGNAFVYPQAMHGRPLSTGETFRHDRLTAGHASIPVGTVVRVTNLSNRLSIDVLVNDKWTGQQSGIIMSNSAAAMIGLVSGTSPQVQIEQLSHPVARQNSIQSVPVPASLPTAQRTGPPLPPQHQQAASNKAPKNPAKGLYFLEFATYKNIIQAKLFAGKLTKKGAPSKVVQDLNGRFHVISDGYFTSLEDASTAYHLVNKNVGYTPVIKQI